MRTYYVKHNEESEGNNGGGKSPEAPPPAAPESPANSEAQGGKLDEFGYEVPAAPEQPNKEDPKPESKDGKKETEKKVEGEEIDEAGGYGVKEPKKEDAPPEKPPEKPEEKIDLGFELDMKDVPADEQKKISQFAKSNGLTKEQAQALVEDKKSELKAVITAQEDSKKEIERRIKETKAGWDKELRSDPVFGGEKFAHNIKQVGKILNEFMPETKKVLTERGSMMPPYVMKGLSRIAEELFKTEKLTQGDPPTPPETEKKETDPLDYYT